MREIVGIHACQEALKVNANQVREMFLRLGWEQSHELRQLAQVAEKRQIPIKAISPKKLSEKGASHQGVALKIQGAPTFDESSLAEEGQQLVVILDEIADPQNLGAIMRTSWLMGAKAIFITDRRSAHVTPSVAKVACGAAEHLPVVKEKHLPGLISDLKDKGFWIYGLSGASQSELWDVELPEKVAWVVGSEAKGIRTPIERICDQLVAIPQADSAASYNASVAAAMAFAETQRQWKNP